MFLIAWGCIVLIPFAVIEKNKDLVSLLAELEWHLRNTEEDAETSNRIWTINVSAIHKFVEFIGSITLKNTA